MSSKPLTLAQFTVPIPLCCAHCDRRLPNSSTVDIQKPYVIVQCPKCGCLTPFKVEEVA